MSWDIYIQDFPTTAATVAEIPVDFQPHSLGKRSELIAKILDVIPSVDFSNYDCGTFHGGDYTIEFQMGLDEICKSIALFVRGNGNPILLIATLLECLNLRGIDSQTGEFFNAEEARTSFSSWQRYRDQVVEHKKVNCI